MARTDTGLYFDAEARRMRARDREMIPTRLVQAMFGMAFGVLILTAAWVWTGQGTTGRPAPATAMATHSLTIEGQGTAIRVTDDTGRVVLDTDQGGFVSVVNDGLERARLVARVAGNPPVEIVEWDDGRITMTDPASGWKTELGSFGPGNLAVWRELVRR